MKIMQNEDGFLAIEKNIQGAFAEVNTKEEAIQELKHVIEMIEDYKAFKK